mmetsp:Transcript_95200/g.211627  ORF Transcript_95200/g.211627 Transcript_95200/m.211627 type:complete len:287 (-) Transcript_95200:306-1166(-)
MGRPAQAMSRRALDGLCSSKSRGDSSPLQPYCRWRPAAAMLELPVAAARKARRVPQPVPCKMTRIARGCWERCQHSPSQRRPRDPPRVACRTPSCYPRHPPLLQCQRGGPSERRRWPCDRGEARLGPAVRQRPGQCRNSLQPLKMATPRTSRLKASTWSCLRVSTTHRTRLCKRGRQSHHRTTSPVTCCAAVQKTPTTLGSGGAWGAPPLQGPLGRCCCFRAASAEAPSHRGRQRRSRSRSSPPTLQPPASCEEAAGLLACPRQWSKQCSAGLLGRLQRRSPPVAA